ncbi:MAG: flavoprotein, partial [Trebonia sp.]
MASSASGCSSSRLSIWSPGACGRDRAPPAVTADRLPWVVGVSGASGTPYAAAVLRGLFAAGQPVDLVVSRAARLTLFD